MAEKGKYVYDWPRPMVTVDAAVFTFSGDKAKVLLINRGNEPFKGKWALPGGFVDMDEELEGAVVRELAEETGLVGVRLEQMRTFGTVGRDPRGRIRLKPATMRQRHNGLIQRNSPKIWHLTMLK